MSRPPCNQAGCTEPASHVVYWPGQPGQPICPVHGVKARGIAETMGFHLEVVPLVELELGREGRS